MIDTVEFETKTRDEAIKCFAILSKGLVPIIESHNAPRIKILIKGSQEGGKSLVIDSIIRTLAKGISAYSMPKHSLLEREPCQSLKQYLVAHFQAVNGQEFVASFYRESKNELYFENVMTKRAEIRKALQGKVPLLEFETAFHKRSLVDEDIVIHVHTPLNQIGKNVWLRQWRISVQNPFLITPQMVSALHQLESFRKNREARALRLVMSAT